MPVIFTEVPAAPVVGERLVIVGAVDEYVADPVDGLKTITNVEPVSVRGFPVSQAEGGQYDPPGDDRYTEALLFHDVVTPDAVKEKPLYTVVDICPC